MYTLPFEGPLSVTAVVVQRAPDTWLRATPARTALTKPPPQPFPLRRHTPVPNPPQQTKRPNSCVGRLGYDLEGKCKDIVARKKARGGGGGGGSRAGRRSPGPKGSAGGPGAGSGSRRASAPNYTSESVIDDIYGGIGSQQARSRDRATRASRRSASSVSERGEGSGGGEGVSGSGRGVGGSRGARPRALPFRWAGVCAAFF